MATTFLKVSTLNSDLENNTNHIATLAKWKLPYGTIVSTCDPTNDKGDSCWKAPFWIRTNETNGTTRPGIGFELSGRKAGVLYLANEGLYFMDQNGVDHIIVNF